MGYFRSLMMKVLLYLLMIMGCSIILIVSGEEHIARYIQAPPESELFQLNNSNKLSLQKRRLSTAAGKGYTHIWPDMEVGWKIIVGTLIGSIGGALGSIGGIGGGGIFVIMFNLILGFDPKSSTAMSKCMIFGSTGSTVCYKLRERHPTLELPAIDYDLALLFQPMLLIGVSIGVTFNVVLPGWTITALLICICLAVSTRSFLKGLKLWKKETLLKKESAANDNEKVESKPVSVGSTEKPKVSIIHNVHWKQVGILFIVWVAILIVQIFKNHTRSCSILYWVLNLLQIPVAVGASGYQALIFYKGEGVHSSNGDGGTNVKAYTLVRYCALGVLAGLIAGLVGLGGGAILGPLFMELGVPPQVSSATASFAMLFSSSMSAIQYYLLKRFPVPYALYFFGVAIISAFIGQSVARRVIALLGRASLIIFTLSSTIFLSGLALGGVGIAHMILSIKNHEYIGFESLCRHQS